MTQLRRLYLDPELVVPLAALALALGGCGTGATNTTPGVGGSMANAGTAGSATGGGGGNASGNGGGGVAGTAAGSAGSAAGATGSAGTGGATGGSGGATGGGGAGGATGSGGSSGGSGGSTAGGGGNGGRGGGGGSTAGGGGNGGRGGGTAGGGGGGGTAGGAGGTGVDPNFTNWPTGSSPQEIGRRLVMNYLNRTLSLTAEMHYAEVGTWYGALTTTKLIPEAALDANLITRFAPLLTAAGADAIPSRAHVDDRIFGIVPLEIYLHNNSQQHLTFGKKFADDQWMTTTADGITTEARYWVDDMYMIPSLQVQTYRATKDTMYLDRAAITAAAYITRLQQPNGLFFHTTTSPRFWGRGNGWFAAGFSELLRELPSNHPQRAAVMAGYTKMMAGLLQYQAASGMWNQLVDNTSAQNWAESSATAMFTFAFVTGVKNGWLPSATYGPAARKAWLALIGYINTNGDVREVCAGTGEAATSGGGTTEATQNAYYLARPRIVGDFHGQAPVLWSASALMR